MLYIAQDYSERLVPNNMEPIVYRIEKWLTHFFRVIRISTNCSLAREIELHQPDIILYDGFIEGLARSMPLVSDITAYPSIPRVGLCRIDSLSPSRAVLFDYFHRVGVEAIFVLGDTTMGHSYPAFAERIFYVPQFIDASIYKDYGLFKSIPVLMVGNFDDKQYPWRQSIKEPVLNRFPTLYFRHPGYDFEKQQGNPVVLYGEDFARTLNSALITPTSGGFRMIAVSKHVEIPGARSCLISDQTKGVQIYGFESHKNCIFADAQEAPDAIDHLLRNRDQLEQITQAGFELVHSRHTMAQRPQIKEWLELRKQKSSLQKIIQPNHFTPLELAPISSNRETIHLSGSLDDDLISEGDQLLWSGDLRSAKERYNEAIAFCFYLAEPHLKGAIVSMLQGKAELALKPLWENLAWLERDGLRSGDPLDVTYALISLLCVGNFEHALNGARSYPNLRRTELHRARWATFAALGRVEELPNLLALENSPEPQSPTLHKLPSFTFDEQIDLFIRMLVSNDRLNLARNLSMLKAQELQKRALAPAMQQSKTA
jgi:hypothetical protein